MQLVKNKKGVTLLETVIYVAVIAVVLTTMSVWMIDLMRIRAKNQVISEVQTNGRLILNRLSDASRHAELVNTGSSTFGSDPGVLSFDMVDAGEDPTVFSLTADDGEFQVSVAGGGATSITSDVVSISNLVFTDLTSSEDLAIIQVEFTVTAVNSTGSPLYDYEESFQSALRIPLDD